jgi:talin
MLSLLGIKLCTTSIFQVSYVLAALQAGSRGTQACINAASTISGIIGDLDTTIMFATAGTLNPETDENMFSDNRTKTCSQITGN